MTRTLALAGLLLLGGCASVPAALLSASLSLAASVLKLDVAIVEYFTAREQGPPLPSPVPGENE